MHDIHMHSNNTANKQSAGTPEVIDCDIEVASGRDEAERKPQESCVERVSERVRSECESGVGAANEHESEAGAARRKARVHEHRATQRIGKMLIELRGLIHRRDCSKSPQRSKLSKQCESLRNRIQNIRREVQERKESSFLEGLGMTHESSVKSNYDFGGSKNFDFASQMSVPAV